MSPELALQLIESHGGNPLRWPDADRAAVLALAEVDARVATALAEAQALDAMLDEWAGDVAPASFDLTAIARTPLEPIERPRRWLAGGALAAAVIAGLLVLAPTNSPQSPPSSVPSATASSEAGISDAEAFAVVFTPTADEEDLI